MRILKVGGLRIECTKTLEGLRVQCHKKAKRVDTSEPSVTTSAMRSPLSIT